MRITIGRTLATTVVSHLWCLLAACGDDVQESRADASTLGDAAPPAEAASDTGTSLSSCAAAGTIEHCEQMDNGCMVVKARRIDPSGDCVAHESTMVACTPLVDRDCALAEGVALHPATGSCFLFTNLCFPEGWEPVSMSHPSCMTSGELCER